MSARTCLLVALTLVPAQALAGQNVVIVLDNSGSMAESMRSDRRTRKIDAAKTALRAVLEQLPDDSQVGLVVLHGGQRGWSIPFGPVDRQSLDNTLNRIRANGGTPLGQFMKVGADALLEAREQQRYGTYKLLIVTDGEAGDQNLVERYLPDILARGLVVDVIGVDMQQNHSLATRVQTYRRADDPASFQQAISDIVLGESTADAGVAGESDFEILAALPDELAVAALTALATQGNHPIGERPALPTSSPPGTAAAQVQTATPPSPATPNRTLTVPVPPSDSGGSAGFLFMSVAGVCCVGGIAVMLILFVGVMLVVKK